MASELPDRADVIAVFEGGHVLGGWHALRLRRPSQIDQQVRDWLIESAGTGGMK